MPPSTRALAVAAVAALALTTAGCGHHDTSSSASPSTASGANRTIEITMTDNAFQPAQIAVAKGETVTLRFANEGTVTHEAVLGDDAAQDRHHQQMGTTIAPGGASGDDHGHTDDHGHGQADHHGGTGGDAVTVEPRRVGRITHTFTEAGTVVIGCHVPGHWESGMKATVVVT